MTASMLVWALVAAALGAGILVVVRTRWLQSRTLEKCVALSVLIHAVLAVVCGLVGDHPRRSSGHVEGEGTTFVMTGSEDPSAPGEPAAATPSDADASTDLGRPVDGDGGPPQLVPRVASSGADVVPPADHVPLLPAADGAGTQSAGASAEETEAPGVRPSSHRVPAAYADRIAGRRAEAALERGGSEASERAVDDALGWLAATQSADGRWDAASHGARAAGHGEPQHHGAAGGRVDHGVTGLALLAFLGAGSTHRTGSYAAEVDRGIRFLVSRQRADGSLAGDAEFFAALYCHAMAAIAVAECLSMTGDDALRPAVERAVAYTLAMQHPQTGGWRYAAGDRGDTSQLGWQLMVLATARNAGLGGFAASEERARGFLGSVSSGAAGGLASYRAGERPSMAMTAEALYCRLVLGGSPVGPAAAEALDVIAAAVPAAGAANAYAWYYATLASFHAGGPQWERWNRRLQEALLPMQRRDGPLAGSWDPDPVWGRHGGRVFATALSSLTLEVYYRHRPLHASDSRAVAARPGGGGR